MNTERDLRKNERLLIPSWSPPREFQGKQVKQVKSFSDDKEGVDQDRNMKHTSFTNQPSLEDLDSQEIEAEDDPVEDDSELAIIAAQLRETASYAINPTFKEKLRKDLLQQFVEHRNVETKPN